MALEATLISSSTFAGFDQRRRGGRFQRLAVLPRGRRGTDVPIQKHAAGEPETVETLVIPLGDLGLARAWRAVGFGTLFEEAETLTRSHSGRDLMPYAPWNVRATGGPSGITLTWVRRTRIGGELRNGTGAVPLGEASEAYELESLGAPGGAVLRTLKAGGPSALYPQADILADFGAVPTTLTITVAQLSALVGRGFPRTVTLGVA